MKDKYRLGGGFEMIHFKFKKIVKFKPKIVIKIGKIKITITKAWIKTYSQR